MKESGYALLLSAIGDRNGVFGPGHNGFFRSPDGTEDWIVYHAKTNSFYTYKGRETRAQKITWSAYGTPNFGEPMPLSAVLDEPSSGRKMLLPENKL